MKTLLAVAALSILAPTPLVQSATLVGDFSNVEDILGMVEQALRIVRVTTHGFRRTCEGFLVKP